MDTFTMFVLTQNFMLNIETLVGLYTLAILLEVKMSSKKYYIF
jgi:hypothetical protein